MNKTSLLIAGASLLLCAVPTQAAVLYTQNFEALTNGQLSLQAGFTADPSPGNAAVENGGLSYTGGAVSVPGGSKNATLNPVNLSNNWAMINTFTAQSSTVYFSLSMTWTNQEQDDFLYFALSNDADSSPVALGNSAGIVINGFGGAAGQVGGRIRNDSSVNTTQTSSGITAGSNTTTTQFIVGSLSKVSSTNYNTLNLWVNPTSTTEGTSNLTITRDMGIFDGLDTFYFFTGSTNENNEVIKLDNITIGQSYGDVVPVPEPSTFGLLVGGFAMLIGSRRFGRNSAS